MDNTLRALVDKVLKKETKKFLDEIEGLMNGQGLQKALNAPKGKKPGRSQFKSLMDVAEKAACVEELVLFFAYQESKKEGWQNDCGDSTIAKNIKRSLTSIIKEIYMLIEKETGLNHINEDDERMIKLFIAQKYMGYLYWKASVVSR